VLALGREGGRGEGEGGRDEENGKTNEKRRETGNVCKKHNPRDVTINHGCIAPATRWTRIFDRHDVRRMRHQHKTEKQLQLPPPLNQIASGVMLDPAPLPRDGSLPQAADSSSDDAAHSAVVASLGVYFRQFGSCMPATVRSKHSPDPTTFLQGQATLPRSVVSSFLAWMASNHTHSSTYMTLQTWDCSTQRMWIMLGVVATAVSADLPLALRGEQYSQCLSASAFERCADTIRRAGGPSLYARKVPAQITVWDMWQWFTGYGTSQPLAKSVMKKSQTDRAADGEHLNALLLTMLLAREVCFVIHYRCFR
jgi:hypothetical protein